MAFNPNPPKAEYQATAGQTNFPFLFKIYFTSDIKVYHTDSTGETVLLTESIGYSVAINGDDGGTVTLILVVENNDYIVLERELELTRYVEYQTSGDLLANTLNADQDYQTYLTSDQNAIKDNSLRLSQGTFGVDTEIPSPVASQYLRWNSSASKIEYAPSSSISIDWGNLSGTLSDQTDLQTELNTLQTNIDTNTSNIATKADTTYVDSQDNLKLNASNPAYTGTLNGTNATISGSILLATDQYQLKGDGTDLVLAHRNPLNPAITIKADSKELILYNNDLSWGTERVVVAPEILDKIEADDYASSVVGGTIKIRVIGTDCYITTDGSTPGP